MQEVYIVEAKRTAIGSFGGSLKDYSAVDLAVPVMEEVLKNTGIQADQVNEVILGNVYKAGVKGNPARQAAIRAGLDVETPAMTIDKQCASGMRSVTIGALQIAAGEADIVIGGGTESMTNVPHLYLNSRQGKKLGDIKIVDGLLQDGLHCAIKGYHMGVTAENLVEKYNISRREQDEFALNSQKKARRAIETKTFAEEIVPLPLKRKGYFKQDEHSRDTNEEQLSNLPAVFKEEGTVTAGNASGLNDGAAVVLLASEQAVKKHNLKPIAKIKSYASAAVDPAYMGVGPVPAINQAMEKANMSIADIDLVEINEAFASQVLAVNRELGIEESTLNVNGGAIALGHPVGCSGARIVVTLLHALKNKQKKYGLASLCVGGGQGVAMVVESL
ncbi:thiolase family protein [Salibacterium aidingense]|uniref:thiolase family protein n=1 Tax=Salibacterium aidingense TaxID=384933 RepID=UPI003BD8DBFD